MEGLEVRLDLQEGWSFEEILDDFYEVDRRVGGLRSYDYLYDQGPVMIPVDFSDTVQVLTVSGNELTWALDLDLQPGSVSSLKSGRYAVKLDKAYKYRHEFVAQAFESGETDKKLMEVFEPEKDDDDVATPDFIIKNESGDFHVVELTTRMGETEEVTRRAFLEKSFIYKAALMKRTGRESITTFSVVVVTPASVVSNVSLPQVLVNELVARMRIAVVLERKAALVHIDIVHDEREGFRQKVRTNIEEDLLEIEPAARAPEGASRTYEQLMITREFMASVLTEPDQKQFEKDFLTQVTKTNERINKEIHLDHNDQVKAFVKGFQEGHRRIDPKPVSIMPFLPCEKSDHPTSTVGNHSVSRKPGGSCMGKVWERAWDLRKLSLNPFVERPEELLNHALKEDMGEIVADERLTSKQRKSYHRVSFKGVLSESEEMELAMQGLWARKHRDSSEAKSRRIHQQSGFKWTTDVSDIDEWLKEVVDFKEGNAPDHEQILSLLRRGNEFHGNTQDGVEIMKKWFSTDLGKALDVMSDIAYEVAISNKQHCRPKEMILKKLRNYEVYLLVSPTNSSEHTFFSIFIPDLVAEPRFEGVFGKMEKVRGGYVSQFLSMKVGKYENLCSMPASLISLASFWSWFYNLEDSSPKSFTDCGEAAKMLKLSLLVRLEDKAGTEETITQSRYMYMEIFKSGYSVLTPEPFKILKKVTQYPRSRLNLYLIHKLIAGFTMMINSPPERIIQQPLESGEEGEDSLPADSWKGLVNWMTGGLVETASKAVNLFYVGYLKNKDETAQGNTDFSILEKTCQEELNLNREKLQKSMGSLSGEAPEPKQFDLNAIKVGSALLERRLSNLYGPDWKTHVNNQIMEALTDRMSTEIASLKASCSIPHTSTRDPASLSTKELFARIKVLEAVCLNLKKLELNPYQNLSKFIRFVETTSRGVIADLFKKLQHGGLREIYVLTIESRILQLYIETMARVLCSQFEEETLTHPRNKTKKLDEHKVTVSRIANRDSCIFVDYCSSTDKTKWNQNLMMSALSVPLLRLTAHQHHGAIQRILNLWSTKLVRLPQRVQNLLLNNTCLSSGTFTEIHKQFWDPKTGSLFRHRHDQFVTLNTGMMQGILHYTSSLLHLTFLYATSSVVPVVLSRSFPGYSFRMSQVCSSDDSATILSILSPPGRRGIIKRDIEVFGRSSRMLHVLDDFAAYFCMKTSEKSCTSSADYVEFNSEFVFKNTLSVPVIKLVAASLSVTESESYNERFHTMYNLISDLLASGLPGPNTHLCQLAQGFNHYKTMGYSTNALFPYWSELIVQYPEPCLGFFLLDNQLLPGAMGFSYSHWQASRATKIFNKTVHDHLSEASVINDAGGIVSSLILKHGEVKRWRSMVDRIRKDMDVKALVEESPEMLFREPRTMMELRGNLVLKATMPAVAKSMRKGNPYMQALAMSVYSLSTHCFSKTTVTQDLTHKVKRTFQKTSVLLELSRRIRSSENSPAPSDEELEVSFPSLDRYKEANSVFTMLRDCELVRCHRFRYRKTCLMVQPMTQHLPVSLLDACCSMWFGFKVRATGRINTRCWEIYKARLPWLKERIKDTLGDSPFETYQELANFLQSQVLRTRRFVRVGPGVFSQRFKGQLYQMVRKSQRDGYVLKGSHTIKREVGSGDLVSRMALSLSLPSQRDREAACKRILASTPLISPHVSNVGKLTSRECRLALIQHYVRGTHKDEIIDAIQSTGSGVVFTYIKEQEKVIDATGRTRWVGYGQCMAMFEKTAILVDMRDSEALKVYTSDWGRLKANSSLLTHVIRELRLKVAVRREPVQGCVSRFDGIHFQTPQGNGIPVLENKRLAPLAHFEGKLHFGIYLGGMHLYQETSSGRLSVIKYNSYPGDVSLVSGTGGGYDYVDCWLNQRSFSMAAASAFILRTHHLSKKKRVSVDVIKSWIEKTLRARLNQKGLGLGSKVALLAEEFVPSQEETNMGDYSQEFFDRIHEMVALDESAALDSMMSLIKEQDEGTDEERLEEDVLDIKIGEGWEVVIGNFEIQEFEENRSVARRADRAFHYMHPLWDELIEGMQAAYPKFWGRLLCGVPTPTERELCDALMFILDLKERKPETTVSEQGLKLVGILSFPDEDLVEDAAGSELESPVVSEDPPSVASLSPSHSIDAVLVDSEPSGSVSPVIPEEDETMFWT